jgi:hypothetical protein
MSEWLLFNSNSAIFQLYHGEHKLIFNGMMMRSVFYKDSMLSWIFIVLAHWNDSPWIDMLQKKKEKQWSTKYYTENWR